MKTVLSFALLLVAFCLSAQAIQVQDGDYSFSLESVRVLQELTGSGAPGKASPRLASPRLTQTGYASVCSSPTLPQEFLPLCRRSGAAMSFARLAAVPMDVCEICAFAACTGC
ncbi:guanylin [Denticeps clupeoides]|uniref:Guanylate cyclase activator 2B n=1 Tax=Denticeps clupeoides TaxID=299321 RepID=A0AAY4ENQ5_9TELE|nr:guanylin-like [Denticeps clupeoides]